MALNKVQKDKVVEIISELGFAPKAQVRKELTAPGAIQAFLDFASDAKIVNSANAEKIDFLRHCAHLGA